MQYSNSKPKVELFWGFVWLSILRTWNIANWASVGLWHCPLLDRNIVDLYWQLAQFAPAAAVCASCDRAGRVLKL